MYVAQLQRHLLTIATVAVCIGTAVPPASAGTLQVTINASANAGAGSGCDLFAPWGTLSLFNVHYPCGGTPLGMGTGIFTPSAGTTIGFQTTAPPGITINSASVTTAYPILQVNDGHGWGGGSYYAGGGAQWYNGQTSEYDGPFNSGYWGFQMVCGWPTCSEAGAIWLGGIRLTATETGAPSLTVVGTNNLWRQTVPGEYIWNPPGDPWQISFSANDPSGVCSMSAFVNGADIPGPSWLPDTSQWQQCPEPTWTQGASVDTNAYAARAGSVSVELEATNAAGVPSVNGPETVHVDNQPVVVALSTPNDANPSVWVNHRVTVTATAVAGPSGISGMTCSVDHGSAKALPKGGLAVDGDGVHTASCTASNNAVGPQGQHNTGSNSMSVHIDEAPPSLGFEPQNPGDPTGLVVDTSDRESGVASGSLQIAPAGSGAWSNLPTSFDGAHLLGRFDDAGLRGNYDFRATSCDNVGNCASSTQRLALPLRIASDQQVSLTKIINPVRRRVVVKRVRVGWHWVTIHRGSHVIRVMRGGHFKTVKITEYVRTCTTKRVRTGPHTWELKHTCAPPHVRLTSTLHVPYGHSVTVHGLYTTGEGVPLSGQTVEIQAAPNNGFAAFAPIATATTAGDGSWTATLPPGPSRIIRAVTGGTATILPSSGEATVIVPAKIRLIKVWPQHVAWGGTVHLVGQLYGGYLPPGGALVRLRIGYKSTYSTYGVEEHVTGDGRFSTVATFGPGDPSIRRAYWFQIASLPMGNYPFAPAASQRVPVIVGGHPG